VKTENVDLINSTSWQSAAKKMQTAASSTKASNAAKTQAKETAKSAELPGTNYNELAEQNTKLNFKIHKETGAVMIQIINDETGEIVREYPPEKILDSIAVIWENAGINVDKKA
jgi:FlaG protein.